MKYGYVYTDPSWGTAKLPNVTVVAAFPDTTNFPDAVSGAYVGYFEDSRGKQLALVSSIDGNFHYAKIKIHYVYI